MHQPAPDGIATAENVVSSYAGWQTAAGGSSVCGNECVCFQSEGINSCIYLIIEQTLAHFASVCSNQKILAYLTGI